MKWLKARYRWLCNTIRSRASMDREVTEEAVAVDIVRILWTAPIIGAGQMLAALGFWLQEIPLIPTEIIWRMWVIGTNSTVAVLNIMIALGAWLIRKKGANRLIQTLLLYTVIIYVLSVGLLLSIIDQLVIPSISPLIISVVLVGTFYYIPPKNSFLIFTTFFLCFYFAFHACTDTGGNILASHLTNGLVACVVGFSLSVVNWEHFRRLKIQQRTIAEQQELLEEMAYQDFLTKVPNRRWMDELIKSEVALVQRKQVESCLIIVDIDDFKYINDTYGHPVGDVLLRDFARLLQENIRDSNTLVRIGGEEFVILARSTSAAQCALLAERLRAKIADHVFRVDHHEIKITASFGVAILQGSESTMDYYSHADQALYHAKQSGKNRVVVFEHPGPGN